MKSKLFALIMVCSATASASATEAVDQFCAPQAAAAAVALANTNGSVSETVERSATKDGKVYTVVLSEKGLGSDTYSVWTSGGHECVAYAVKVKGQPTLRP